MTELSNEQFETCNEYLVLVSNLTGVAVNDITGSRRHERIAEARQLTMWALVTLCGMTHQQVGILMRRHHRTVTYAVTHVTRGYNGKVLEKYKNKIIEYHKKGEK